MTFDFDMLFTLTVVACALLVIWQVVRPKWTIRIVAAPGEVKSMTGVPLRQQARLEQFLIDDVPLTGEVRIQASRRSDGSLAVQVRGNIDDGLRQRIRNYLITIL